MSACNGTFAIGGVFPMKNGQTVLRSKGVQFYELIPKLLDGENPRRH